MGKGRQGSVWLSFLLINALITGHRPMMKFLKSNQLIGVKLK